MNGVTFGNAKNNVSLSLLRVYACVDMHMHKIVGGGPDDALSLFHFNLILYLLYTTLLTTNRIH